MNSFNPDPLLLGFLLLKTFLYLPLAAVLALARVLAGRGLARLWAYAALALALAGSATIFAPAFNLGQGPLYVTAAQAMMALNGMATPLAVGFLMLLSAVAPAPNRRWIDLTHALILLALMGLWALST